jgi:hypothetical protein
LQLHVRASIKNLRSLRFLFKKKIGLWDHVAVCVCLCIPPSLLGNGSVETLPR